MRRRGLAENSRFENRRLCDWKANAAGEGGRSGCE